MSSTLSEMPITTQSGGSIHSGSVNHHISISPTIRYSYENPDTRHRFALAFPLVVNHDYTRQVLTVIEEPSFLITLGSTIYYTSDDPDTLFSFDNGEIQIGRDAVLLRRPDGWIVAVPDKWFRGITHKMHLKRLLGYMCLSSYLDSN